METIPQITQIIQSAARRYGHAPAQIEQSLTTALIQPEKSFPYRDNQGRLHLANRTNGHNVQITLDANDNLVGVGCATCHQFSHSKSIVCPDAAAVAVHYVARQLGVA